MCGQLPWLAALAATTVARHTRKGRLYYWFLHKKYYFRLFLRDKFWLKHKTKPFLNQNIAFYCTYIILFHENVKSAMELLVTKKRLFIKNPTNKDGTCVHVRATTATRCARLTVARYTRKCRLYYWFLHEKYYSRAGENGLF